MSDPVTIIIYSSDHAIYKPDCLTSICAYVFLKTIPGKGFFLKIYGHSILKNEQGQVRTPLRCSVFFFFFFKVCSLLPGRPQHGAVVRGQATSVFEKKIKR